MNWTVFITKTKIFISIFLIINLLSFANVDKTESANYSSHQARNYELAPSPSNTDRWLYVPRLLFRVPRFLLDVAFYPIIKTGNWIQKKAVIAHVEDFLYNDARTMAILPTATFQNTPGQSLGLRAFHKDLFSHHERLELEGRYGGNNLQFYELSFEAPKMMGSYLWIDSRLRYEFNSALVFAGFGHPKSEVSGSSLNPYDSHVLSRFRQDRQLAVLRSGVNLGSDKKKKSIGASFIFNKRKFQSKGGSIHGSGKDDPSITDVYDTNLIPGFHQRVDLFESTIDFEINTLNHQGQPSRGYHLETFVGGVPRQKGYQYWHYGLDNSFYFNLYRHNRVLQIRTMFDAVEGSQDEIPFFALPRLGGRYHLRGFERDQFRDKKTALLSLGYHYPIHQYIQGELFVDFGTLSRHWSHLAKKFESDFGLAFLIGSKDSLKVKVDMGYGDGFQFSLSINPKTFFSRRSQKL